MLKRELEKLYFSEKESVVYLAVLELGEASIERISQKSRVRRTTVYDVIESLKEKGLIGSSKRKKRVYYFAQDPRVLDTQLEEKKKTLNNILPELLSIANFFDKKPKIQYFEGKEGIKNIYKDTLKFPRSEILMWGSTDVMDYLDRSFLCDYYIAERVKRKVSMRAIGLDSEITRKIKSEDHKYLRQTRLVVEQNLLFEIEINLYGRDKIALMSFKEQIGLIIESQKIYNTLKSIFELNWKSLE